VPLPWPCSNAQYESIMQTAIDGFVADGFTHVAFGDLFLEDVRRIREDRLAARARAALSNLENQADADLARDMIEGGLQARLTCIDPRKLDRSFAGRTFDRAVAGGSAAGHRSVRRKRRIPFVCFAGPMFHRSIRSRLGDVVDRDGFVFATMSYPSRIVCLTEETTETLYLLGEGDRVVGISGYTVRPPEARQKPKVSSFLHARYEKIEALKPDLILAFSDLQADITNDLVKRGYPVFTFNQRSVAEILQMIRVLAGIVGVPEKGSALAPKFERDLDAIRERAARCPAAEGLLRGVVRPA
jgi:hypothetical protein